MLESKDCKHTNDTPNWKILFMVDTTPGAHNESTFTELELKVRLHLLN